jgi:hypothetical protein
LDSVLTKSSFLPEAASLLPAISVHRDLKVLALARFFFCEISMGQLEDMELDSLILVGCSIHFSGAFDFRGFTSLRRLRIAPCHMIERTNISSFDEQVPWFLPPHLEEFCVCLPQLEKFKTSWIRADYCTSLKRM